MLPGRWAWDCSAQELPYLPSLSQSASIKAIAAGWTIATVTYRRMWRCTPIRMEYESGIGPQRNIPPKNSAGCPERPARETVSPYSVPNKGEGAITTPTPAKK